MFGCLRRVIALVVVLCIAAGVYVFRDRVKHEVRAMRGLRDTPEVASPELGTVAAQKIDDLHNHKTDRIAMGSVELQSLVQYKYAGVLPAFAKDPHIDVTGDHARLRVRVPVDKLPNVKGLGEVAAFLPDTADVELSGTMIPLTDGRVALGVDAVQVAHIPLPSRMISDVLRRVGRRDEAGLPQDAIAIALPAGVKTAYIRNDSLILLAKPGN